MLHYVTSQPSIAFPAAFPAGSDGDQIDALADFLDLAPEARRSPRWPRTFIPAFHRWYASQRPG
jgi:hypothetical protein